MSVLPAAAPTPTEQGTGGLAAFPVNMPAVVAAGQVLVASINGGGGVTSTPAGWQLIGGSNQAGADSCYGFLKIANGTEGGTQVTFTTGAAGRATAFVTPYNGVDLVNPLDVAASTGQNAGVGSTCSIGSISPVTGGAYLIGGCCGNAAVGPPVWTPPAGWSNFAQSTGTGKGSAYAEGGAVPAGATGAKVWAWSQTNVAMDGWMAALRPASGLSITYDNDNARVRINAVGLGAINYATVERSTDQVRWTLVRNGTQVAVSGGAFNATLDDYEFTAGVTNYYRVRGISTAASVLVAAATAVSAAQGSLTPNMPAGVVSGDLVLLFASTRNSGTGTVDTPAGWMPLATSGNVKLLGRIYDGVWTMPTVTFTGGAALEDTIVQSAAFRGPDINPVTFATLLNASAQNIATPLANNPVAGALAIVAGWKQDDWTSVAALAGFTEIQEAVSIAGNDAGQVWDYQVQTAAAAVPASSLVVTGGAAAISRGLVVVLPHQAYLSQQTGSIVPNLDRVWLKSVTRPFLNRAVVTTDPGDPAWQDRGTVNDVVGRSLPIAVTDARDAPSFALQLYTRTADDAQTLEYVIASGDVLFIHVPANCPVRGGYVEIADVGTRRPRPRATSKVWTLPCQTVSAPDPSINYAIGTWTTVLNSYASWSALLAANPTWADVLKLIAPPSEVIVP